MSTHAEVAAILLRDAAQFYLVIARDNADIRATMTENAAIYGRVAALVESDPTGKTEGACRKPSKTN